MSCKVLCDHPKIVSLILWIIGASGLSFVPTSVYGQSACKNCHLIMLEGGQPTERLIASLNAIDFGKSKYMSTLCSTRIVGDILPELIVEIEAASFAVTRTSEYIMSKRFSRELLLMAREDQVVSNAGLVVGDRGEIAMCRQMVALAARRLIINANARSLYNKASLRTVADIQSRPSVAAALDIIVRHSASSHRIFTRRILTFYYKLLKAGDLDPSRFAGLADAIAYVERSEQIYGTRISCVSGKWEFSPAIRNISFMRKKRSQIGYDSDDSIIGTRCGVLS
jgi:hypothetical protein